MNSITMPKNYVAMTNDEMMYTDGGGLVKLYAGQKFISDAKVASLVGAYNAAEIVGGTIASVLYILGISAPAAAILTICSGTFALSASMLNSHNASDGINGGTYVNIYYYVW
jgi:hypothetical protein